MADQSVASVLLALYQRPHKVYVVDGLESKGELETFCTTDLVQSVIWALLEATQVSAPLITGMYGIRGKIIDSKKEHQLFLGYILFPEAPGWRLIVNDRVYQQAMTFENVVQVLTAEVIAQVNRTLGLTLDEREIIFPYTPAKDLTVDSLKLDMTSKA